MSLYLSVVLLYAGILFYVLCCQPNSHETIIVAGAWEKGYVARLSCISHPIKTSRPHLSLVLLVHLRNHSSDAEGQHHSGGARYFLNDNMSVKVAVTVLAMHFSSVHR
jgi:hypothetical protein